MLRPATSLIALAIAVGLAKPGHAYAGEYYVYSCSSYHNSAPAFAPVTGGANWTTSNECAAGRSLEINQFSAVSRGKSSGWVAYSPSPAIAIVGAATPANTVLVDCTLHTDGFRAFYAWPGGAKAILPQYGCPAGSTSVGTGIDQAIPASSSFGWGAACTSSSGCKSEANGKVLGVSGIRLTAEENTGPRLQAIPASNLWYANSWVRGPWPVTIDASDPSGVCWLLTVVDGKAVGGWSDQAPDTSSFFQCHGSQLPGQLNTSDYANGQHTLTYGATNAAGVSSSASKTIYIDSSPVTVSLSGPTDAPLAAGTQYVHASATAGPSGVGAILCSVDGGTYQRFAGSSAQVPVSGGGLHHISCYAQNNALDAAGAPATSPTQTWDLTIRQPTVVAAAFSKVVDALRCRGRRERVHHHAIHVTRCRPRTAWQRRVVWRTVRKHGKLVRTRELRETRVLLLPHVINKTTRRLRFGAGTTVNGWLGLPNGTALPGQAVHVYAAPDNGQHAFTEVAVVNSGPDGAWTARLPPGPSREVIGVYLGSAAYEPAASAPIKLIVPARIRIVRLWPNHVKWGQTVHIEGYLAGGYLPPPPAGELVRLRIGLGNQYTTYGVKIDVTGSGRFHTSYTFGIGAASVRRDYWFQFQALPQDDYPYATANSRRATVHVGG